LLSDCHAGYKQQKETTGWSRIQIYDIKRPSQQGLSMILSSMVDNMQSHENLTFGIKIMP
jgi:hypothetical protein